MALKAFAYNKTTLIFFFLVLPPILRSFLNVENGSITKILLYSIYWIPLFLLPYNNFKRLKQKYNNSFVYLFLCILIIGIFYIIKDINKGEIMTLLGNPLIGLPFLLPIYVLLSDKLTFWESLIKLSSTLILFLPIFLIANLSIEGLLNITTPLSFIILPYLSKNKKWIPYINLFIVLIWVFLLEGQRYMLLLQIFSILNWGIVYLIKKRIITKFLIAIIIIIPVISFCMSIINKESVFSSLNQYTSNEEMSADTRTFLYVELFDDLSRTDSWLMGKGPLGRYYSNYFDTLTDVNGDSASRIGIEVGILQYLLKGGIIYLSLYLLILIGAIIFSLTKKRMLLFHSFAFLLATHFFMLFIYELPTYSLMNAVYWLMIGTCFSKKWLNMTDQEVKTYFKL